MTTSVSKYKIYCVTEHCYVEGWGTDPPATCYNNIDHAVNLNSIQLVETITGGSSSAEYFVNHGKFHIIPISISAAPNSTTTINIPFKYTFNVYSVKFATTADNYGDVISCMYNPDATFGLTTDTVANNTNILPANTDAVSGIIPGYYLKITDDVNTSDLGVCIEVDPMLGTITTDANTTYEFAAGSKIQATYYLLYQVPLGHPGLYVLGDTMEPKPVVRRGMTGRVEYTNMSQSATKTLTIYMECAD